MLSFSLSEYVCKILVYTHHRTYQLLQKFINNLCRWKQLLNKNTMTLDEYFMLYFRDWLLWSCYKEKKPLSKKLNLKAAMLEVCLPRKRCWDILKNIKYIFNNRFKWRFCFDYGGILRVFIHTIWEDKKIYSWISFYSI